MCTKIDSLLDEYYGIKETLKNQQAAYTAKRDEIFNELTINGINEYSNLSWSVNKTDDMTYLSVTKDELYRALATVDITEEQKQEIQRIAMHEIERAAGVRIARK